MGSWLKDVKQHIWAGQPDSYRFMATLYFEHRKVEQEFGLGEVREQLTTITRGQKIAYVVDCRYDQENEEKIVELAHDADVFYCEAPFLDQDLEKAQSRYHLTAKQAGLLAKKAQVRELVVFHFSPRYTGLAEKIRQEARTAFVETESGQQLGVGAQS